MVNRCPLLSTCSQPIPTEFPAFIANFCIAVFAQLSPPQSYQVGSLCRYQLCPILQNRNLVFAPRKFSIPNFVFKHTHYLLFSNGRQTVGDGAVTFDNEPSVLAVCHLQGTENKYYYSTTFSGGPGVSFSAYYP